MSDHITNPIVSLAASLQSQAARSSGKHCSLRFNISPSTTTIHSMLTPATLSRIPKHLSRILIARLDARVAQAVFPAKDAKMLVESLGGGYGHWCLLDSISFSMIARILLAAEPCLERDLGLFRMIVCILPFSWMRCLRVLADIGAGGTGSFEG
jgi:hypothetical protein